MKLYRWFLSEANIAQLKHLEHLPEAILTIGYDGAKESIEVLRSLQQDLSGKTRSPIIKSQKWDGAPALVFGIDPEDGKFFVGTKGVFAKSPKVIKQKSDIRELIKNRAIHSKLEIALAFLPKIVPTTGGVYQGDMLFTKGDTSTETIDGEELLTFKPNTIVYAIPTDNSLADSILRAKIGIIIHTTYTGTDSLQSMTAAPGQIDISKFRKSSNVWFDDPYVKDLSGNVTMTVSENLKVLKHVSAAESILKKIKANDIGKLIHFADKLPSYAKSGGSVAPFLNSFLKASDSASFPNPGEGDRYAQQFPDFLKAKFINKIDTLKTDKGKEKVQQDLDKWGDKIDVNLVSKVINFIASVNAGMLIILNKLSEGVGNFKTFSQDGNTFNVTSGEGFVVTDHITGNTWKLVDRLEFSRLNFKPKEFD
ncbi:MAG: hypothetical protein QGH83_02630 [Candidatus Pacebacteria bacterium]|jgi:hypothetical protein|nr:hypothetical protein [Candidatus Paceibacterota bacterium]